MKDVIYKDDVAILKKTNSEIFVLSSLCGSIGMYTIEIQLNEEELANYKEYGNGYITKLSKEISQNPDKYSDRAINI